MSLTEKLPLFKPNALLRNIAVSILYFFVIMMVLGAIVGGGDSGDNGDDAIEADDVEDAEEADDEATDEAEEDTDDVEETEEDADDSEAEEAVEEVDEADDADEAVEEEAEEVEAAEEAVDEDDTNGLSDSEYESRASQVYEQQTNGQWLGYSDGHAEVTSASYGDTNVLASEIGAMAGTYAFWVGEGGAPERFTVTVYEADGTTVAGTYYIKSEWAEGYNDGSMSDEEFFTNVLNTIDA
jgi:hypothetical protein